VSVSENHRWHAAGHLASAHILAAHGQPEAARLLLSVVQQWTRLDNVQAPPAVHELLALSQDDPESNLATIALLEGWFCNPFNTTLEASGAKFS